MKELSSAYYRYLKVDQELEESRRRMAHIIGLLGPDRIEKIMKNDETKSLQETLAENRSPQQLREGLRLWVAVREYLREVPGKSKVGDIQAFLDWLGMEDVIRQAIEFALKRHSDSFKITKKGHERYVELREMPR
ncbi:MAG TPA: hypothetical protein VNE63_16685 [Candidatus Acidoferrales bacterium]|nr:hypothetical protein [Candidatus Acidoferrales bacterium]